MTFLILGSGAREYAMLKDYIEIHYKVKVSIVVQLSRIMELV